MMAHAERVVELLDSLGIEQCSLVGHSMGGGIALYVSLILGEQERPELVTDLVLIDSVAYPQSLPCFIRSLRFPVVSRIGAWAVPPRTQARIGQREVFYNDHAIPEELIGLYAEPLFHADGRHAILSTARHITPNNADDLVAQIPHIRIPVTIIWGEEDSVVPLSNGERLHQDIEHSTFHIIPECGHAPQEEKPQETLGILREHYSNCKKSRPN
jgi:pimeloyl-ACP methyl ester carboxylesterase